LFEVFLGMIDHELEGTDLVVQMILVVADAADDAFLYALRFHTDQVEHLSRMDASLGAEGVLVFLGVHSGMYLMR
jgi:hypothetical protein